ncbi:MAG: phage holin family protein [Flavobacteriaceae bacterium]|jgi:hypothetical protein|nr:phage holin family protein [Flavobacteriaceae bacterium]
MFGILKKYVNKRLELLKLEFVEYSSRLVSILIFAFIIILSAFMFFFLLSLAIGMMIGRYFDNPGLGILIFSAIYLLLFIILLLNHKKVKDFVMKKIAEMQLNYIDEDEDENDED